MPAPRQRATVSAGLAGLFVFALTSTAHTTASRNDFRATVGVQSSALVVEDRSALADQSRGRFVGAGISAINGGAAYRVVFNSHNNASPNQLNALPGCTRTVEELHRAEFECPAAGLDRLRWVIAPERSGLNDVRLGVSGPLPLTASLGVESDTFTLRPDRADSVDGGTGRDTLLLESVFNLAETALAGVRYSNDGVANDGFAEHGQTANVRGFELVDTGVAADVLTGGEDADALNAGAGDDTVAGKGGADVLEGERGNDGIQGGNGDDRIVGGGGVDTVGGGQGDDTLLMRDGETDVLECDPGTNTYDVDLKDDLATVEECTTASVTPRLPIARTVAQLDVQLREGDSLGSGFTVPPGPGFGAGAVNEKPNVVVRSGLVRTRGRTARLLLRCPRRTTGGCSGVAQLRDLRGRTIATAKRHRIRAGRRGVATVRLPRGRQSRPGARLVLARIVETGAHGPKTSGAVVALAIRR